MKKKYYIISFSILFSLLILYFSWKPLFKYFFNPFSKIKKSPIKIAPKQFSCADSLSLEQSLGQLFFIGFYGHTLRPKIKEWIYKRNLGGIIIFGRNVRNEKQLQWLTKNIKHWNAQNPSPLLIATDHEPGSFMSIRIGSTWPPLSQLKSKKIIFETVNQSMAADLAKWGFNMNFHPVIDIQNPKQKSPLDYRIYSSHADEVADFGVNTQKIFWQKGIISVAKHFPGHGRSAVDSHFALPVLPLSLTDVKKEITPFAAFIQAGGQAIMLAHILYPAIDSRFPVSLSFTFIQSVLRKELGFSGLVLTDDMAMLAIAHHFSSFDAARHAILAGADFLLYTQWSIQGVTIDQIFFHLLDQAKQDLAFRNQIENTCSHIINQKIEIFDQKKNLAGLYPHPKKDRKIQ